MSFPGSPWVTAAARVVAAGLAIAAVLPVVALSACSTPGPAGPSGESWVGTITTEGNVTTVVNESGSVWGGTATLVEEASIGVEAGAEEYMFGLINSVYATDDRIYVADVQVPAVRVYDHDGNFIRNLGRSGQGPDEYQYPAARSFSRAVTVASTCTRHRASHSTHGQCRPHAVAPGPCIFSRGKPSGRRSRNGTSGGPSAATGFRQSVHPGPTGR